MKTCGLVLEKEAGGADLLTVLGYEASALLLRDSGFKPLITCTHNPLGMIGNGQSSQKKKFNSVSLLPASFSF